MAEYDEQEQKLTIKLVYYGPALSGKTTNLMSLHNLIDPQLLVLLKQLMSSAISSLLKA